MSFRNGVLAICALAIICASGCRSAGGGRPLQPATHEPASDVVILLEFSPEGKFEKATPDTAYLESPEQRLIWYSNGPDFVIKYTDAPLPDCEKKGKGRCEMKVPKGYRGRHNYVVHPVPPSGEAKMVDPIIIVDY